MNPRTQRITSVLALFLVFCISQVYVGLSFAAPDKATSGSGTPASQLQDPDGILTTVGNKSITVNGASAITGTTILSGASIETPDAVGATVGLGIRGSLQIEPNAKLTLNFHAGSIKVMLIEGCVALSAKKGTTGEIETSKGPVGKTDPKQDSVLRVCNPDSVKMASAVAIRGGLGSLAMLALLGGPAAVILPVIGPGSNPSNSTP